VVCWKLESMVLSRRYIREKSVLVVGDVDSRAIFATFIRWASQQA
jgi:hypothetical protein